MKKVEAVIRPERLEYLAAELEKAGYQGFTIIDVRGHGQSPEAMGEYRGQTYELHFAHKLLVEIIVADDEVEAVVDAIIRGAQTGTVGDGIITVTELGAAFQIRGGTNLETEEAPA